MILFMVFDGLISMAALMRYSARNSGEEPANIIEEMVDEHFPDERMKEIYPYAKIVR